MQKFQSYMLKIVLPILFIIPFTMNYFYTQNTNLEKQLDMDDDIVILNNDQISITLHLNGGFIDNFSSNKYKTKILKSFKINECFESGWINSNVNSVPNRSTKWRVLSYSKNSITIFTNINGYRFNKIITLNDNEITIREYTNFYQPGQYFTVISVNKNNLNSNLFVFANNKLNNTPTSQISNEKIPTQLNHKRWMGIDDNFLCLFCENNNNEVNGKFFYKNDSSKQLFFLYDENDYYDITYKMILIEKNPVLLSKYDFQIIVDYGWFVQFISKALSNFLYSMHKKISNPIILLLLLAILMVLLKIWFIFKSTEEYYKIYHHLEEKEEIIGRHDFSAIDTYYQKYDVKKGYFSLDYMITFILVYISNKVINSFIFIHNTKFLWLKDISILPSILSINFINIIFFRMLLSYLGTLYQYRCVDNMNIYINFIFLLFITNNMNMAMHIFLIFAALLQEIIHYVYLRYLLAYKKVYIS